MIRMYIHKVILFTKLCLTHTCYWVVPKLLNAVLHTLNVNCHPAQDAYRHGGMEATVRAGQWLKWIRVHAQVLLTKYLRYFSGSFSFSSGSIRLISLWIIALRICTCTFTCTFTHIPHVHTQAQTHTHTHTNTNTHTHNYKPQLPYITKRCYQYTTFWMFIVELEFYIHSVKSKHTVGASR